MKISILTERLRPGFGVDLVVDQQATRLAKLGFDVTVVVIHADVVQPPRAYKLIVINKIMQVGDLQSEAGMRQVLSRCKLTADLWMLHTPPFYEWARYLDGPVISTEYGAPPGHFFTADIGQNIDKMAEKRLTEEYSQYLPCDTIVSISPLNSQLVAE